MTSPSSRDRGATSTSLANQLATAWPPADWQDVTVVVAVSGGGDSVALLRGLLELQPGGRGRLCVAHANHQLRGTAAEEDSQFVAGLAQAWGLECRLGRLQIEATQGEGPAAAARRARYQFMRQTCAELGARFLATGHTADDQVETILHRVIRGTGIAGLAGIPPARRLSEATTLVRPLLGIRRRTLRSYLQEIGQEFREDATNQDLRQTRSRIRHRLIPLLEEEFDSHCTDAVLRLGTLARQTEQILRSEVDRLLAHVELLPHSATIAVAPLAHLPRHLVRELMVEIWRTQGWPRQEMGWQEWEQLAELATSNRPQPVAYTLPGAVIAHRHDRHLCLSSGSQSGLAG